MHYRVLCFGYASKYVCTYYTYTRKLNVVIETQNDDSVKLFHYNNVLKLHFMLYS